MRHVGSGRPINLGSTSMIAPLDEIVKLKEEFFYQLILDISHGMTLECFGLRPMVHCEILTFSLEHSLGSVGGVRVGCEEVVNHQRLVQVLRRF